MLLKNQVKKWGNGLEKSHAETLGCKCIGTAGILVLARRRNLLPSLRDAFAKLSNSGIWLSRDLVEELCRLEGE